MAVGPGDGAVDGLELGPELGVVVGLGVTIVSQSNIRSLGLYKALLDAITVSKLVSPAILMLIISPFV